MEEGKGECVRRGRRSREEDRRYYHALVDTDPQYELVASHSVAPVRSTQRESWGGSDPGSSTEESSRRRVRAQAKAGRRWWCVSRGLEHNEEYE